MECEYKVGIVGTGFIARGLSLLLKEDKNFQISRMLTRRNKQDVTDLPLRANQLTYSVQELIDNSDIVVECSGDPIHGTEVLSEVLEAGIPVVTMNCELQITSGTWLAKKGLITEAEGDQPGSLAALEKDTLAMGFVPLVLGNIKGFLNHNPGLEEMKYWGDRSGISLSQVTSFTDGTKLQIEQTLIANGLKAKIVRRGLSGIECTDYTDGAIKLAEKAELLGEKISDYVLSPKSPAGVFVVAKHMADQAPFLKYYKLGNGPFYVLVRPFHLCHLELPKTIRGVLRGDGILLNNGENPHVSVATIAKRELLPGEVIKRGIGSFAVRGEAVNIIDYNDHIPIGLVFDAIIKRNVRPEQILTFDDVEIPKSKALQAWRETVQY